jgi:hypothetical protein
MVNYHSPLYVDDILITGDNEEENNTIQLVLQKDFKMIDLGIAKNYLGIDIEYHPI